MENKCLLINKPGDYEHKLVLSEVGQKSKLTIVMKAEMTGNYNLVLLTDHMEKNTHGRVEVRGVAANGAMLNIKGMVKIEENASGSDSFLSMKVLILDDISSAVAEPQLEIENNNVKASHSASVGKIDEEQLYYLESRGIEKKNAKQLIVDGFIGGVNNLTLGNEK